METNFGNLGDVSVVQSKLPKKLKKRKPITREDGSTEYVLHTYIISQFLYLWILIIEGLNVNILLEYLAGMKNTLIIYTQKNHRQQILRFLKLLTSGRSRSLHLLKRITIN